MLADQNEIVCQSCLQENNSEAINCRFCNAPLILSDNIDPVKGLPNEGYAYSKAVEGKPKLVVLIGVWVMFFPLLLITGFSALSVIFTDIGGGSIAFIIFWVCIAAFIFSFAMLYRVTKNYLSANHEKTQALD